MTTNVGTTDRTVRITAGLVLAVIALFGTTGTLAIVLLLVAAVLVVTGFVRFCPAYSLFNFSTERGTRHHTPA